MTSDYRTAGTNAPADRIAELEQRLAEAEALIQQLREEGAKQSLEHSKHAVELDTKLAAVEAELQQAEHEYCECEAEYKLWLQELQQKLDATNADIDRLNQMLRATGYGQGQIDAYAAECEAREQAEEAARWLYRQYLLRGPDSECVTERWPWLDKEQDRG